MTINFQVPERSEHLLSAQRLSASEEKLFSMELTRAAHPTKKTDIGGATLIYAAYIVIFILKQRC
jgi:hypothetical protein